MQKALEESLPKKILMKMISATQDQNPFKGNCSILMICDMSEAISKIKNISKKKSKRCTLWHPKLKLTMGSSMIQI
jgi:hypothetical protein